jgi:retinol dehydrogenase-12
VQGAGVSRVSHSKATIQRRSNMGCLGIISTSLNPGNLRTELVRDRSWFEQFVASWLNHPPEMGAWTELYAGWSPDITPAMNGCYLIPWGRVGRYNEALEKAIEEGKGQELWKVCEGIVAKWR